MYQQLVAFVNSLNATARVVPSRLPTWLNSINRVTARDSLVIIMVIGALSGVVFGVFPQLDLRTTAYFYDPLHHTWPTNRSVLLGFLRDLNGYVAIIFVVIAVGARPFAAMFSRAQPYICLRRAIFLVGSFLLGPGLIVNVLLKPEWGRPRPGEISQFGGSLDFEPWWNPFGNCSSNCSFVSGEESLAFWFLAWAIVLPPQYRVAAVTAALLNCLVVGIGRISVGAHFASDVIFAVVLTALAIWIMHRIAFAGISAMDDPTNGAARYRSPPNKI